MTVWALSVAEAFSELRVELCRESHALLLIVDAGIEGSTPVSEQLQQLQVLRDSCVKALQPNRQPEVLLVAAVSLATLSISPVTLTLPYRF
ncbi:hypothetical protein cyc_04552 [Cyclospora cayetanensis]|uniref:Uncharacterized protein n=1 Tax=Cyclospora cayetanensis TaxID=88456 RepID=A0A1D3CXR2_9EIME|nr:hypothetical protein cyc_04552 [Cyclospora cayetanensis]